MYNLDMILAVGYRVTTPQQAERRMATTMVQWVSVTDGMLQGFNLERLDGLGTVSHEAIEALVDRQWPGFAEARRQRDADEALEIEAADITALLEIERRRREGASGAPA